MTMTPAEIEKLMTKDENDVRFYAWYKQRFGNYPTTKIGEDGNEVYSHESAMAFAAWFYLTGEYIPALRAMAGQIAGLREALERNKVNIDNGIKWVGDFESMYEYEEGKAARNQAAQALTESADYAKLGEVENG